MKTGAWCSIEAGRRVWLLAQVWLLLYMGLEASGLLLPGGDSNLFASFYLSFSAAAVGLAVCLCGRHGGGGRVSFAGCLTVVVLLLCYLSLWQFRPEIVREASACVWLFGVGTVVLSKPSFRKVLYAVLAGWAVWMALYGLLQQCGLLVEQGAAFPVKGVFDNPAGLGMFLALLFPYVLACRCASPVRWTLVLLVGCVLTLSGSRTGILAAVVAAYVCFFPSLPRWGRVALPVAGVLLFAGLYFCKPVSAGGRVFVACITSRLAAAHLWTGGGPFAFESGYMAEQAAYFAAHPASVWVNVADDMKQPFNEYLHFFVRFGLVGAGWLLLCLCLICKRAVQTFEVDKRPALASLAALAVFACFSYPFYYPLVCLVAIVSLGVLCAGSGENALFPKRLFGFVAVCSLGLSVLSAVQLVKERARLALEQRAENGELGETLSQEYEALSQTAYFRTHPSFLYNRALFLYECGEYADCLLVLEQCKPYKYDYDWQMLSAYTLLRLDETRAEAAFRQASCMLPGRLQPRYELVRLYDRTGRHDDALRCAREAMAIPLKVRNVRTEYLRRWLEGYVHENSSREVVSGRKGR